MAQVNPNERTWQGFAYVAFVIDVYSRRIVGWNVASTLKADMLPLTALGEYPQSCSLKFPRSRG